MTDKQVDMQVLGVPSLILDLDRAAVPTTVSVDCKGAARSFCLQAIESVGTEVLDANQRVGSAFRFRFLGDHLLACKMKAGVAYGSNTCEWIEESDARQFRRTVEVLRHEAAGLIVSSALGVARNQIDSATDLGGTVRKVAFELNDCCGGKRGIRNVRNRYPVDRNWTCLWLRVLLRKHRGGSEQHGCEADGEMRGLSWHESFQTCRGLREKSTTYLD